MPVVYKAVVLCWGILQSKTLIVLAILGGIAICVMWALTINSYKKLNSAKFAIIHKMEERLPVALYADEWVALGKGRRWLYGVTDRNKSSCQSPEIGPPDMNAMEGGQITSC